MSDPLHKNGVMDQGIYRKQSIQIKCTECEYRVQDRNDVSHTILEMRWDATQFPTLLFFGPHVKPHSVQI